MAKYKLLMQHYIDDRLLEAGTIIGEGTEVPFLDKDGKPLQPTPYMEGLDDDSAKEVAKAVAIDEGTMTPLAEPSEAGAPEAK